MAAAPRTCAKLSSILIAHDTAASQCTKDSRPKLIVVTEASLGQSLRLTVSEYTY
jgi:hypothetical protein